MVLSSQVSFDPIINSSLVEKGRIIFQQKCTTCHFPDKKFIGPAMKGIYTKRSPEWDDDNDYQSRANE